MGLGAMSIVVSAGRMADVGAVSLAGAWLLTDGHNGCGVELRH